MSSTMSGIWIHQASSEQVPKGPASLDSTSDSNDPSSSSSATISSNDFLTLLVTELQNQDPTANTDPNEYVNQLVQVNSLEQLISINQKISAPGGSTSSTPQTPQASSDTSVTHSPAGRPENGLAQTQTSLDAAQSISVSTRAHQPTLIQHAPGNLSIPHANPAAQRVASALGG